MNWISERESLAEEFAEKAERASSYLLSSRASRKLHEEGDQAAEEIERFKIQIQKRYLLSVSNKFYSFPYTELTFDNPIEDREISDLIGKGLYCLYSQSEDFPPDSVLETESARVQRKEASELNSKVQAVLEGIRAQRSKLNQILELISNRRVVRCEERHSKSKERKLGFKYGVIREEDEELLRKRLYTQPYEKQAGFIVKKK